MTSEKSRVSENFTVTAGKRAAREKRSCLSYQVKSFGAVFAHKAVLRDRNMFAQISEKKEKEKEKKDEACFYNQSEVEFCVVYRQVQTLY